VKVLAKDVKMLFKHLHTSHVILVCCIALAFIKIYQHNLIININYELQRLERQHSLRIKERNELFAKISQINAPELVMHDAQTKLHMTALPTDHVVLLDTKPSPINFIGSVPTSHMLLALQIIDNNMNITGDKHACT
jgi:hypothetical protein